MAVESVGRHARRVHRHQQRGHAVCSSVDRAGAAEDDGDVGLVGGRDRRLLAVDHVGVARTCRHTLDLQPKVGCVRAAARFGQRDRAQRIARHQLLEPRAHDLGLAVVRQDLAVERREQVDVADAQVGARDLLVDHARGHAAQALAAVGLGQLGRDEPHLAHRLHQAAIEHARLVALLEAGGDAIGREAARVIGQRHQVFVEVRVHVCLHGLVPRLTDCLQRFRIDEGAEVARLFAEPGRADHTTHHFHVARAWQIGNEHNHGRLERAAQARDDGGRRGPSPPRTLIGVRARDAHTHHGRALDGVGNTDRGGILQQPRTHQQRLDLGRPGALAGDLERVVGLRPCTNHMPSHRGSRSHRAPTGRQARPVALQIALAVMPQPAREADGGCAHHQFARDASTDGSSIGIDDVGTGARHRACERARHERMNHGAGEDAAHLGSAREVEQRHAALAHALEGPVPGLGRPGLAGGDHHAQRAEVTLGQRRSGSDIDRRATVGARPR